MSHGHQPRKRFGQHFLHDPGILDKIVRAISPEADDDMVEIGPGLGALTRPLLDRLRHLHVVELDRDLVARLEGEYAPERLTVHAADVLKFDFAALPAPLRVVGNLPYNISSPILFHLMRFVDRIRDCHFMLQKEVVMRMAAQPGSAEYGRLSVMLQWKLNIQRLFDVPAGAFQPPPKVESAIVRMIPLAAPLECDPAQLSEAVRQAFTQRRKTLRNALRNMISPGELVGIGIDPGLRPEMLSVDAFVRIANHRGSPAR
jgi:16S rRNA (adenine1518-N6/adenine1519-N6)-dimethyltransferase